MLAFHRVIQMFDTLPMHLLFFAIASHLLIFKQFTALHFDLATTLLIGLPTAFLVGESSLDLLSLQTSTIIKCYVLFYAYLGLSTILYRLSPFHRLYHFPGPLICRVSKLWIVYIAYKGQYYKYLKELHGKYGDFVRVGPEEISIGTSDGVIDVLGAGGLPKGRFNDPARTTNGPNPLNVLTGEEHAKRRRLWNRGMSTESLAEYAGLISRRAEQLVNVIPCDQGPVNIMDWINYFSFDFMGDMAFGGGYELMKAGYDKDELIKTLDKNMVTAVMVSNIPWARKMLGRLPYLNERIYKQRAYGKRIAAARFDRDSDKKDLWYHLMDKAGLEKEKPSKESVVSDGMLAINAGADTTARVVTFLIFLLLDNPTWLHRVRAEVDAAFPTGENTLDLSKYGSLTYLEACINETLRLYPPVPSNGSRRVPNGSGGRLIAGRFIPEGTEVFISSYVLHRSSRNFAPHTETFWPDRWLSSVLNAPELCEPPEGRVHNTIAFIPFSYGPHNCAGRNLARLEIKMLMSLILSRFEMSLAENFDNDTWLASFRDYFVLRPTKPLYVILKRRDPKC